MHHFYLALAAVFIAITPARARTDDASGRTEIRTVSSEILGEERRLYVRVPIDYDRAERYPVVFVLDAEWNFELVAAHLDFLTDNGVAPKMIVTGIVNVNRNRDYVPRADEYFADTGEAAAFLQFVQSEWIPAIETNFSASDERVLVGHSFGGVFTLYAFFENPELFNANISISASAWIGERVLFEEAAARFEEGVPEGRFVFMTAGEYDGGPTLPSGRDLAALFESDAPGTLDWEFSVIPRAEHFRAVTGGLHEGFDLLFPSAGFAGEARAAGETGGAEAVRGWFAEKRIALGWRFHPLWFDMGVAAAGMSRNGDAEAAIAIVEETAPFHPDNASFASLAAQVYENAGRLEKARSEFDRAVRLAEEYDLHPNAIDIDRLQAGLARIDAKISDAAQK
ncbi:MAG: alpha/beta hydrolase-fold protein [Pseudomonadota bacterium]